MNNQSTGFGVCRHTVRQAFPRLHKRGSTRPKQSTLEKQITRLGLVRTRES